MNQKKKFRTTAHTIAKTVWTNGTAGHNKNNNNRLKVRHILNVIMLYMSFFRSVSLCFSLLSSVSKSWFFSWNFTFDWVGHGAPKQLAVLRIFFSSCICLFHLNLYVPYFSYILICVYVVVWWKNTFFGYLFQIHNLLSYFARKMFDFLRSWNLVIIRMPIIRCAQRKYRISCDAAIQKWKATKKEKSFRTRIVWTDESNEQPYKQTRWSLIISAVSLLNLD